MSEITETMLGELESAASAYDSYSSSAESMSVGCDECTNQCQVSCSGTCEGDCEGSCYTTPH